MAISRRGGFRRPKPLSAIDPRYEAQKRQPPDFVSAVNWTEEASPEALKAYVDRFGFDAEAAKQARWDHEVGSAMREGLKRRAEQDERRGRLGG